MSEKKRKNGGMTTVEVSYLIPFLLILLTGILCFMLFLLDMAAAKSETIRQVDETAYVWKTGGELATGVYEVDTLLHRSSTYLLTKAGSAIKAPARERGRKRISSRLSVAKMAKNSVQIKNTKISAQTQLTYQWPLAGISSVIGSRGNTFTSHAQATIDNWEEWLRSVR